MNAELTVAMPARNVAPYIGAALESVLQQTELSLHIIVIDDASDDGTADAARVVAARYPDVPVQLLRNEVRRGIGWCHNRILLAAKTPFLVHVDADDVVLPGALARMLDALRTNPRAGQAYCDFDLLPDAHDSHADMHSSWREALARARRPPIQVRRQLLVHGMVVNHLRAYRCDALREVGGFDESLPWAVDYEVALRLAERWEFVHVAAYLYVKRVLAIGASESVRAKPWRFFVMRWRLAHRQARANGGRLMGFSSPMVSLLLLCGLALLIRDGVTQPFRARRRA